MKKVKVSLGLTMIVATLGFVSLALANEEAPRECVNIGESTGRCIIIGGQSSCSSTASEGDVCSGIYIPTQSID